MKRVFETAECEVVRSSIFWELRYLKHENQMKGCATELKVSDWQMYRVCPALCHLHAPLKSHVVVAVVVRRL